jgi:hypothetical protein
MFLDFTKVEKIFLVTGKTYAIIDQDFRTIFLTDTQGNFCGTVLFLITSRSCYQSRKNLSRNR